MRTRGVGWSLVVFGLGCTAAGSGCTAAVAHSDPRPLAERPDWRCPSHSRSDGLPVPYHRTGDYCEGMYPIEVGATQLLTVSLTDAVDDVDLHADAPIHIDWIDARSDVTYLTGTYLGAVPYDLDVKPDLRRSFDWPTTGVRKVARNIDELGFLVWTKRLGQSARLYFPARIHQGGPGAPRPAQPRVVVVPGTQLEQLRVTIGSADEQGHLRTKLVDGRDGGSVFYPANTPVVLQLDELAVAPTGYYLVEVTARASSGILVPALDHWLYHQL